MLDTRARKPLDKVFTPMAKGVLRLGLRPGHVTALALATGLGAGVALYAQLPFLAVGLLWLSGLMDVMDGSMARLSGSQSLLGAVLDVVCDRVVELGIVWALALRHPGSLVPLLGLVSAILLSMTVFLTTGMLAAQSGPKSFYYQAGLMERTEGFIAFSAMMLFQQWLWWLTWIFAALIGVTIVQRLAEAATLAARSGKGKGEE